ncbi:restriction endonuclease DpnII [Sneathia vaginalis]|uniref:Type-2 restriction enzyme n=1 Tax=Sneathia vaginalis TaxID=187101 RepID=A0A0E3ZBD7_9FUSO|nr:type II restriction endonuclease [Sneathia vaginalis]AKC95767.1 restriction endonuclease DpnII [Sneathia vaginalis]
MERDFDKWFETFIESISSYDYYINFKKVYENVSDIEIKLNLLNYMVGKPNIEEVFVEIIKKYPECLECIPILLAVRNKEIKIFENEEVIEYNFDRKDENIEKFKYFMKRSGLFNLISKHCINNLVDYVLGVEVGLDSNGRKNRGGHLMEDLVEGYLIKSGLKKDVTYFKEMKISKIEGKWGLDLSAISNKGKTEKRFDFVIKGENKVYGIETNFYFNNGSKLNETARSYKTIALESNEIEKFEFVWITDGYGWKGAKNNLIETYEIMEHLYNINDLKNGIIERLK